MSTGSPPSPSGPLELSATVRRAVAALGRRLRGGRPEHGVSLAKLSVLGRLYRLGQMSAATLASQERIKPQSLTRLLATLEQRGFIKRRPDESDGRRTLIEITPTGKEVLTRDMRQRDAWLALAMSTELSGTEQELLRIAAPLLERLADAQGIVALRRTISEGKSKVLEGEIEPAARIRKAHA
jgi:DNA-binding MarR family transcriptional regulator